MLIAGILALAVAAGDVGGAAAAQRTRTTTAPAPEPVAEAPMTREDAAELRRMLQELSRQVTLMRKELGERSRPQQTAPRSGLDERQFNANRERLKVIQEEILRLRQQRSELIRQQRDAQDRAEDAEARLTNIQGQMVGAIELDRQAAEARIRRQLERIRDQARSDIADLDRSIGQIDDRITELEQAASLIRGRLGITPETAGEETEDAEEPPAVLDTGEAPDDLGQP
jgi:chromosome segregation ATPase